MPLAFLFPGQGSQAIEMGVALAEAFGSSRQVFEEVDEALKQNHLGGGGPLAIGGSPSGERAACRAA